MKSFASRGLLLLGLAVLLLGVSADVAVAAQQKWASQYVHWTFDNPSLKVWNIDQQIWIPEPNQTSFWPLQWEWIGTPGLGGYLGLQEGGSEQRVRFSLWNALEASGDDCTEFSGEGIGYTCIAPVKIDTRKFYRLRLWRTHAEADGQWWGAWLIEEGADRELIEHKIAEIKVPPELKEVNPRSISNFVEFYGDALGRCDEVPLSVAGFTPPAVNYRGKGTGIYGGYSKYSRSDTAELNLCVTGQEAQGALISVQPYGFGFAEGALVFLGGHRACHALNPRSHPTPPDMPDS